jgi:2-polyprenyl-3-methyl-5-hydroxy-6-metoxy-1,4-benzoquinol methylase
MIPTFVSNENQNSPLLFAAFYTADFIAASTAPTAKSLLDVGCGDGLITQEMQSRGYSIVAIDGNIKSIEQAKANGVDAIYTTLEDFEHQPFDCIYISRALHHMPPLKQTLDKIDSLLSENGTVIIEDFGFDLADEAACAWLFEQSRRVLSELTEPVCSDFHHQWLQAQVKTAGDAFMHWNRRYSIDHQLWSSSEMLSALSEHFQVQSKSNVPYLFRFICDLLPGTVSGAVQSRQVFADEQRSINDGTIAAVGFRVVAVKS